MATKRSGRKTLLSIVSNPEGRRMLREIATIRGDTVHVSEKVDPFGSTEVTERLMRRKRAGLFMSITEDRHLVVGRTFNNEIIDMADFRIDSHRSIGEFPCAGPELYAKYFVVLQNIDDGRLGNLVVDLFNMRSTRVCLESIRYSWVFSRTDKGYVLKYVRVLQDLSVEDCGPSFEMELIRSYHCGDELYKRAIDEPSRPKKKTRRNEFRDKIGTIHIDRQDLKDIRLRRSKGYKNKHAVEG